MPIFHPELSPTSKRGGIPSGSGFTSIFGSLANSYMLNVAIYRYCKTYNIKDFSDKYRVYVSSDDTIISSDFYIDFNLLSSIMSDLFGVEIELESYSEPGKSGVFFLGSYWENGLPYRNHNRMIARIIFGSGNYPMMSDLELVQSRCFEILGNTCEYNLIYSTFGIPYPKRVFRFLELADFVARTKIIAMRNRFEKTQGRRAEATLSPQGGGSVKVRLMPDEKTGDKIRVGRLVPACIRKPTSG
jgi:hypothetical protein